MQTVLTERRKHGSTTLGALLIVLGAIALMVPFFAALFLIRVITWLLVFAAIEQVIYAFRTRGEGGLFLKVWLAPLYAVAGGPLLSRPVDGAIAVTALIGSWKRPLDRRWLDVGRGLVTVAVGRSFDARIGAFLTPAGAFRAGSEPAASDRVQPGS